ncbi:MAG: hypothetical protein K0V04_22395 [Deltaproteobacteria bacterium]|nr:hypothetical protein [Deltaproteobacteria bacterium]
MLGCGDDAGIGTGSGGSSTGTSPPVTGSEGSTTAVDDPMATSSGGLDSTGTGPGLPPVDCSDFVGQATPEQVAMTPREDEEAEQLALEASGEVVAPQDIYARTVADLQTIRDDAPTLTKVHARPNWALDALWVALTPSALDALNMGTYQGWDCPNALYGVQSVDPEVLADTSEIRYPGRFNPELIVADYEALDTVLDASPVIGGGDGNDVCLAVDGDVHTYIFDQGRGDCPAGCTEHLYSGFTIDGRGSLDSLGTYEITDEDPLPPPPEWFTAAADCTMWL